MLIGQFDLSTYNAAVAALCALALAAVVSGEWPVSLRSAARLAFRVAEILAAFALLYTTERLYRHFYYRGNMVAMGLLLLAHAVTPRVWRRG